MQHVVLITTKQPSSNPRLLKEAVCLSEAGYKVSVVYNFWSSWAEKADVSIVRKYPAINWVKAASGPGGSATGYWYTRIRFKIFRILATVLKSNRWLQASATSQFYPELKKNAVRLQAALYIAHNIGALPAAAAAAKK
ncbi:MAG: hypothetical protein IPP72_19070 [Chitinophagaceae bacterium]|nr:hypothetical protein [Chitinophagaceae bacterium]